MTDSEFIVFLPKLWVPTNFHTGSQELGLSGYSGYPGVAGGKMDRMAYYLYSISFSAVLFDVVVVHSDDMM